MNKLKGKGKDYPMSDTCATFKVTVKGDVADAVKKAKAKVKSEGGNFDGDEKGGSFSYALKPSFVGSLNGTYTVDGKTITIKTVTKGAISCDKASSTIQDYFKT
jgi:hypothetical protein